MNTFRPSGQKSKIQFPSFPPLSSGIRDIPAKVGDKFLYYLGHPFKLCCLLCFSLINILQTVRRSGNEGNLGGSKTKATKFTPATSHARFFYLFYLNNAILIHQLQSTLIDHSNLGSPSILILINEDLQNEFLKASCKE